jgi:hypothetical protein
VSEGHVRPREVFAARFAELLEAAALPYARVAARATARRPQGQTWSVSANRISAWKHGENVPQRVDVLEAVVRVLIERARNKVEVRAVSDGLFDENEWRKCWQSARHSSTPSESIRRYNQTARNDYSASLPIRESTARHVDEWDPYQLGVHLSITTEGDSDSGGSRSLTPYIEREHDRRLRD